MKNIAHEENGNIVFTCFVDDNTVIDFPHIILDEIPDLPNEVFYIENNELKIDQDKLTVFNRKKLPFLTKRQFNFYLKSIGRLDEVRVLLASNEDTQLEYESVFEIHRNSPTVFAMGHALGLTDEQVDQMWQEALQL